MGFSRVEIEHTVSERNILAKNAHPFLVSLKFSFQTEHKLYLGLDYIQGGELFVVLQVPPPPLSSPPLRPISITPLTMTAGRCLC
jgi:hypothetical protein